jgi:hypothetical protein
MYTKFFCTLLASSQKSGSSLHEENIQHEWTGPTMPGMWSGNIETAWAKKW